ncbi:MAG: YkgJ family cysteine cluster protein [Proteobacteria bacterium]|nr:YkgJ family cysteine cluster protein [Pseudomonadota bacterium]
MTHNVDALAQYMTMIKKVDAFCMTVKEAYMGAMACQKGCDSCCQHLSLFPVEAVHIRLALDASPKEIQKIIREKALSCIDDPQGSCPLLNQGVCLLYPVRPIICRTHGFPILVDGSDGKRMDHCPLNFKENQDIKRQHILDLETLNSTLTVINRLFINEFLGDDAFPDRLLLAEALLMDIFSDDPS